jgi:hypothetical protein
MARAEAKGAEGGSVRSQLVGHDHRGHETLPREQLAHQLQGRALVPSALNQHVEDFALVVHRAPEIHRLATDPHHHFIEMPLRAWPRAAPSELSSKRWSELQNPATDGFIGKVEATLREKILNVPIAE